MEVPVTVAVVFAGTGTDAPVTAGGSVMDNGDGGAAMTADAGDGAAGNGPAAV